MTSQKGFITTDYILMVALAVVVIILAYFALARLDSSPQSLILAKQKYIDSQISRLNENNYPQLADDLYKDGYITNSLFTNTQSLINSYSNNTFSSNSAYSTMICVDSIPDEFRYGAITLNNNTASLSVNVYVPTSPLPTKYTANWVLNGSWKLDNVSC